MRIILKKINKKGSFWIKKNFKREKKKIYFWDEKTRITNNRFFA